MKYRKNSKIPIQSKTLTFVFTPKKQTKTTNRYISTTSLHETSSNLFSESLYEKKIIQQTCKSDTHIKLSIYSTQYTVKRPKKSELCRDRDSGLCRALYNVQCACRIS